VTDLKQFKLAISSSNAFLGFNAYQLSTLHFVLLGLRKTNRNSCRIFQCQNHPETNTAFYD